MSNAREIVETIKAGLADDADELARRRATNACDALLAVVDAEPGRPLAPPDPAALPVGRPPGVPQSLVQPRVDPGLLLDAVIAKLKAQLPADKPADGAPSAIELRIPFVPLPKPRGPGD